MCVYNTLWLLSSTDPLASHHKQNSLFPKYPFPVIQVDDDDDDDDLQANCYSLPGLPSNFFSSHSSSQCPQVDVHIHFHPIRPAHSLGPQIS